MAPDTGDSLLREKAPLMESPLASLDSTHVNLTQTSGLSHPALSAVVPIYNSVAVLSELVRRLETVLSAVTPTFEIVLVNDGSSDQSWVRILELTRTHPSVRGINLMRNYGQHNALLAGIRAARHEVIVTLDDDLQNPPEEIPRLLDKLAQGYDVIYGTARRTRRGVLRTLATHLTKLALQNAMGIEHASQVSTFRVFRTRVRDAFANAQSGFVAIDVLLTWGATRFSAVTVRHEPRKVGTSTYTFWRLVTIALNLVTGFSILPLQFASIVGFVFTFFGLGVLVFVIGRYLMQGGSVPGFPFLASIIAIFSGAQLFALGVIGEYLARVHVRMMGKPTYVIRDDTESQPG
jgi:undecaprenyl-phosphate 4-deoxy-4-formamido-L-arabinose transferase